MFLKNFIGKILIILLVLSIPPEIFSANVEMELEAVFIGRFASFIQWENNTGTGDFLDIVLIDENPYGDVIINLYSEKRINNKPVRIKHVTRLDEIGECDILVITATSIKLVEELISYSHKKGILTISNQRGFIERGGIIQIEFINQRPKLKVNVDAATKSGIKIDATLLAIAHEIIRGGKSEIFN